MKICLFDISALSLLTNNLVKSLNHCRELLNSRVQLVDCTFELADLLILLLTVHDKLLHGGDLINTRFEFTDRIEG